MEVKVGDETPGEDQDGPFPLKTRGVSRITPFLLSTLQKVNYWNKTI